MAKRKKYTFYAVAAIVALLVCALLGGIRVGGYKNSSHPYYSKTEVSIGTSYRTWIKVSVFYGEMSGSGIVLTVLVPGDGTLNTYKEISLEFVDGKWKLELRTSQMFIDDFQLHTQ